MNREKKFFFALEKRTWKEVHAQSLIIARKNSRIPNHCRSKHSSGFSRLTFSGFTKRNPSGFFYCLFLGIYYPKTALPFDYLCGNTTHADFRGPIACISPDFYPRQRDFNPGTKNRVKSPCCTVFSEFTKFSVVRIYCVWFKSPEMATFGKTIPFYNDGNVWQDGTPRSIFFLCEVPSESGRRTSPRAPQRIRIKAPDQK